MKTVRVMLYNEILLFLREPFALFFTLLFPLILLLIFGSVYGSLSVADGFRFIDIYVPSLFAMVIANLGLMSLPITFADYRDRGILKHYQVTPVSKTTIISVHVIVQLLMFLLSAFLIVLVGKIIFQIQFGGNLFVFSLVMLLSMASMYALGFAIGSFTSTVRTAQTTGAAVFFIMLFSSGAAIPRGEFPQWLRDITEYVPLSHVVDLSTSVWTGGSVTEHPLSVGLLFAIFLISLFIALKNFRWQPS